MSCYITLFLQRIKKTLEGEKTCRGYHWLVGSAHVAPEDGSNEEVLHSKTSPIRSSVSGFFHESHPSHQRSAAPSANHVAIGQISGLKVWECCLIGQRFTKRKRERGLFGRNNTGKVSFDSHPSSA